MKCAVVDVGSNTIRIVAYELEGEHFTQLINEKVFVRLINDVQQNILSKTGISKIVQTLKEMKKLAELIRCESFGCFGTSSLRNLENQDQVLERVKQETGIAIEVLSGDKEAYYDYIGLLSSVEKEDGMGCDLGGGSCQLFTIQKRKLEDKISLPIGSLRMYNQFVKGLFPRENEEKRLYSHIKNVLKGYCFLGKNENEDLFVMGGSGRAMAKLHLALLGASAEIDGYRMKAKDIGVMLETLRNMKMDGVRLINRLLPDRVQTVVPGMLILKAVCKCSNIKNLQIVKNGVREGYLLSRFASAGREDEH